MQTRSTEVAPWPPAGVLAALASTVGALRIRPVCPNGQPVPRRRPTNVWSPEGRAVALTEAGRPRLEVLDGPRGRLRSIPNGA